MQTLNALTLAAVVGSGTAAGLFFTFSNFVMPALARLKPANGIEAMQAINITVINPGALGVMLGTGVLALAIAIIAGITADGTAIWAHVGPALVYLIGSVGVTVFGNVPLNERLAKTDAQSAEAATLWQHYRERWTRWNTLRAGASAISCVGFAYALLAC